MSKDRPFYRIERFRCSLTAFTILTPPTIMSSEGSMARRENARRGRPASSDRRGDPDPTARARLLVRQDAVACLVAADAAAKVAPGPVLERVRTILQEATARIDDVASARDTGAVVLPISPERRA